MTIEFSVDPVSLAKLMFQIISWYIKQWLRFWKWLETKMPFTAVLLIYSIIFSLLSATQIFGFISPHVIPQLAPFYLELAKIFCFAGLSIYGFALLALLVQGVYKGWKMSVSRQSRA